MLSKENNELLTRTGPDTPMGQYFRRFWMPFALAEELPGPDCAPVRVRLLGEDLVAFRDTGGRLGLVDAYCPHRNAPMFFGRNEEMGLRCIYHGWKFDVDGHCVDLPNCPEGAAFKSRVKIASYKVWEGGGILWAFLGPQDRVPPPPALEFLDVPESNRYVQKFFVNCNYMQAVENEFNDNHLPFLHRELAVPPNGGPYEAITGSPALRQRMEATLADVLKPKDLTIVDTGFGQVSVEREAGAEAGTERLKVSSPFWLPSFSAAGPLNAPGVLSVNLRAPVDDENIVFFRCKWSLRPISQKARQEMTSGGFEFPELIPGTFIPRANKSNDYEQDRLRQRFQNFSGIASLPVQDIAMLENQRGPIADRSRETLVSSDKWIIKARRRLLNGARALLDGVEPAEPWQPDAYRVRAGVVEVPAGTPVEEGIRPLLVPAGWRYFDAAGECIEITDAEAGSLAGSDTRS